MKTRRCVSGPNCRNLAYDRKGREVSQAIRSSRRDPLCLDCASWGPQRPKDFGKNVTLESDEEYDE